jgi:type IV pilus biogenesis protein CpaD/CtpE
MKQWVVVLALTIGGAACAAKAPRTAPAHPAAATNHPPVLRALCNPCTVSVGKSAMLSADATDPDGDALTYSWRAPAGTLAAQSAPQTSWTAPTIEGPVPVTVRVGDGKGATASDVITIQVIK